MITRKKTVGVRAGHNLQISISNVPHCDNNWRNLYTEIISADLTVFKQNLIFGNAFKPKQRYV